MNSSRPYVFLLMDKRTLKLIPGVTSNTMPVAYARMWNGKYNKSKLPIGWVEAETYYASVAKKQKAIPAP